MSQIGIPDLVMSKLIACMNFQVQDLCVNHQNKLISRFTFSFQRWDENDQDVMEASLNKHGKKQQKNPPIGVSGRASAVDKESCHHPPIQDMTKISRPKHSCQRHSHKGTTSTNCSSTHSTADSRYTTDSCRCSDLTAGQCHCHCNSSEVAPRPTSLPQCKVLSESIPPPPCSLESKALNRKNINKHSKCKFLPPSSSSSHLENIPRSEVEYSPCKEGCLISARKEIPQIVLQRELSCDDSSDSSNVVDVLYGANVELFKNAKVLSDHRFRGKDDSFVSPSLKVDTCTDFVLHPLLSPRSSNGSICSARSSNADSAVDILTPDEELYSVGDVQIPADSVDWFTSSCDSPQRDTTISLAEAVLPIPAVVISDHSEPLEDVAEDSYCLDSGTECRLTLRRNASNSSLCSNDSSLSSSPALSRTESNVSLTETDEEIPVETKPKVRYIDIFFLQTFDSIRVVAFLEKNSESDRPKRLIFTLTKKKFFVQHVHQDRLFFQYTLLFAQKHMILIDILHSYLLHEYMLLNHI